TSAPRSARSIVPNGPAPYCSTAMTVTPVSGSGCDEFMAGSYPVPLDQPLGDYETLNLVRALADDEERGIAIQALDDELLAVTVAAMNAHRFERVLNRCFGRKQLGHARLVVASLAAIQGLGRLPDQKT